MMLPGLLYLKLKWSLFYRVDMKKQEDSISSKSPVPEVLLPSTAMTENGKRAVSPAITYSVAMFSSFSSGL